jgi:hypothetical protein
MLIQIHYYLSNRIASNEVNIQRTDILLENTYMNNENWAFDLFYFLDILQK